MLVSIADHRSWDFSGKTLEFRIPPLVLSRSGSKGMLSDHPATPSEFFYLTVVTILGSSRRWFRVSGFVFRDVVLSSILEKSG